MPLTAQSEVGRIRHLLLKDAREAFGDQTGIDASWQRLNFLERPELSTAMEEYSAFVRLLEAEGISIDYLPADATTTMDSIYVRDASIVTDAGPLLCNMGKLERAGEPAACASTYLRLGRAPAGAVTGTGRIEGGDVAWLDPRTLVVGRGYRTNDEGIAQLRALLAPGIELIVVPLPHWQGPADVFHLMSFLSPIDRNLLLVYSPLLPVPFRELLLARGFELVEVPAEEFDSMGCNVLALAPRRVLMLEGNPLTRRRLEAAGTEVLTYTGNEISRKGCGGPTCLTRPLLRELP